MIASDTEWSPSSENSTPAKSSASALSAESGSCSSGSMDEPSDFESFRGPYLSTREILCDMDNYRPAANIDLGALSDVSSQPEQLEHPSVDECWIVTPPPCFVGSEHVEVTTSPLENLLIEHPSMSVYYPSHRVAPRIRLTPLEPPTVELQPMVQPAAPAATAEVAAAMLPPPVPAPGLIAHRRILPIPRHLFPAAVSRTSNPSTWRAVGARSRRENSRRFIDRCNHVVSAAANASMCRSRQFRAMKNSGMNNNRHCH